MRSPLTTEGKTHPPATLFCVLLPAAEKVTPEGQRASCNATKHETLKDIENGTERIEFA
jgi:hypothetical protein